MWAIVGPFDGQVGDVSFQKTKLLKPNSSYILGRKDKDLNLSNKKISADHCEFIIGDHTADDAGDPSLKPSLRLTNHLKKGRMLSIMRGDAQVLVEPDQSVELGDGDRVSVLSGIVVNITWIQVCAYIPPTRGQDSISIAACASLGIKLVHLPRPEITHHLISHYVANLSTATSLLTLSRFVKPEWLHEVLRLGALPRNNEDASGTSLEDNLILPLESKYRPAFSPSLLPSQKHFNIWEPNEERVNLFNSCRFICLQEKVRESDSEVKEAIHRGAGTLEAFDIHSGVLKFNRAITRSQAKAGKKTVVVGDADLMQLAVGKDTCHEFVAEARTFELEILPPSKIIQAVLETNLELLFPDVSADDDAGPSEPAVRNSSPLPEMAPNTMASEPSVGSEETLATVPKEPPRKLVRRAPSRAPSAEPSIPPTFPSTSTIDESLPRPRRVLTRRAVPALEGDSFTVDAASKVPPRPKTPPRTVHDLTAPTPARSSKLKRRAMGGGKILLDEPQSGIGETMGEPPLKKFKALFEASNPTGTGGESYDMESSVPIELSTMSQTQTQNDAQSRPPRSMALSSLGILREEEEEATQSMVGISSSQRGQKRRMGSAEDIEMEIPNDIDAAPGAPVPIAKKRAVEHVNAVERDSAATGSKPPSTVGVPKQTQGATVGIPDTDAAFLKAIASKKRGKKAEDPFDREFNKLRISRPELDTREPEEDWAVLADFGDDSGLRGNFMTIVELDLYKKDPSQQKVPNPIWNGKPNFKKFKQKTIAPRTIVEVFLHEENDYGMGAAYWKSGNSQPANHAHANTFGSQMQSQMDFQSQKKPHQKASGQPLLDSDEEEAPPVRKSRQPPSRAGSAAPAKKQLSKVNKAPKAAAALFLDSDDDIHEVKVDYEDEEARGEVEEEASLTLRSSGETKTAAPRRPTKTSKAPVKAKKAAPIIVDDDSDDGVFKGFKGRK